MPWRIWTMSSMHVMPKYTPRYVLQRPLKPALSPLHQHCKLNLSLIFDSAVLLKHHTRGYFGIQTRGEISHQVLKLTYLLGHDSRLASALLVRIVFEIYSELSPYTALVSNDSCFLCLITVNQCILMSLHYTKKTS